MLENKPSVSGKEAFDLFQTYGFPIELTQEFTKVASLEELQEELRKHQELSRTASAGQFKGGLADNSEKVIRLHTATHLMNAALKKVLGPDVMQKGSNITEERTRFDFVHKSKMTDEEKTKVEELVNGWIGRDLKVRKDTMSLDEAYKQGVTGAFGEKYPETVSVYTIYDPSTEEVVSREFCGGPHVDHVGVIGKFKIQKEESVSGGVRRIKAIIE
jgi:alanyl-tRNA synthetase